MFKYASDISTLHIINKNPKGLLRAKRKLVSFTFNYVVVPMHIALIGTLVFIAEVVTAFNTKLIEAQALSQSENASSTTQKT